MPGLDVAVNAIKFTFQNIFYLIQISWVAVVILIILKNLVILTDLGLGRVGEIWVLLLPEFFLYGMIAVAWHRYVLLGEKIERNWFLAFDYRLIRYVMQLLAIGGILILLTIPVGLILVIVGNNILVKFCLMLGLAFIISILSLVLPAKALDVKSVAIGNIWKSAKPHAIFLFFGTLLVSAVTYSITLIGSIGTNLIVGLGEPGLIGPLSTVFSTAMTLVAQLLASAIYLTFLSLALRKVYDLPENLGKVVA